MKMVVRLFQNFSPYNNRLSGEPSIGVKNAERSDKHFS
jgi:hypothetical protein